MGPPGLYPPLYQVRVFCDSRLFCYVCVSVSDRVRTMYNTIFIRMCAHMVPHDSPYPYTHPGTQSPRNCSLLAVTFGSHTQVTLVNTHNIQQTQMYTEALTIFLVYVLVAGGRVHVSGMRVCVCVCNVYV